MLDGITFASLMLDGLRLSAMIAVPVSILIALFAPAPWRSRLAWYWALLPVAVDVAVALASAAFGGPTIVLLLFLVSLTPIWSVMAFLAYILVDRLRRFSNGFDGRDSS